MTDILVIGSPLLDISVNVDEAYLKKYDLRLNNAIVAEEKHMPIFEEIVKGKVDYIAGGSAINTTRVAQWMLGEKHKNKTTCIGSIGKDETGVLLKQLTEKAGIKSHFLIDDNGASGRCAVLLREKERSLVTFRGAPYNFSHFQSTESQAVVERTKYFYSTGFFIPVSLETLIATGKHATAHNKLFLFNLGAPYVIKSFTNQLLEVLEYVDVVFANESEAQALGEKMGWGNDLQVVATRLAELPKMNSTRSRIVVFTQGGDPVIVYDNGKITLHTTPRVPSEEIVDTNGAGDSFVGGFIAAYVLSKNIAKCVEAGNYAAGVVIRHSGCSFPSSSSFIL